MSYLSMYKPFKFFSKADLFLRLEPQKNLRDDVSRQYWYENELPSFVRDFRGIVFKKTIQCKTLNTDSPFWYLSALRQITLFSRAVADSKAEWLIFRVHGVVSRYLLVGGR